MSRSDDVLQGLPGFGHRAFGYKDGNLELHPEEAAVIREAYEAVLDRGATVAEVSQLWNALGLKTPFGNPWRAETVRRLLARKRNAGIVVHAGVEREDIEAAWQPLVSRVTFDATAEVLEKRARSRYAVPVSPVYLASGLARCGTCGSALKTVSVSPAQARTGVMFGCPQRGRTAARLDHALVHVEPVEEAVHDAVVKALLRAPADLAENELQNIANTVAGLVQERRDVLAALRDPSLGVRLEDLKPRLKDIEDELRALDFERREVLRRTDMLAVRVGGNATSTDRFDALPLRSRRSLVKALLLIKVNPPGVVPQVKIRSRPSRLW